MSRLKESRQDDNSFEADFCQETLGTSVHSDFPTNECYPLSNLVSNDPRARRSGFLFESFVRPPVWIILKFQTKLEIKWISFSSQVSLQQSSLFEIFARRSPDDEFVRIGRGGHSEGYNELFFNPRYRNQVSKENGHCLTNRNGILSKVGELKIQILRTVGSNTPGLADLKVEARVTRAQDLEKFSASRAHATSDCSSSRLGFYQTADPLEEPRKIVHEEQPKRNNSETLRVEGNSSELLDAITNLPMTFPLVLPSGYIIDENTLRRYTIEEDRWGRAPNDPFTKKPFTKNMKPVALECATKVKLTHNNPRLPK